MHAPRKIMIAVCILTFRRPQLLRRALLSLLDQASDGTWDYSILVVDNDSEMSGRQVAEELSLASSGRIRYTVERRWGISRARNRALDESGGADFVVFIDDDEYVVGSWLAHMVRVQRETEADAVLGPVYPEFEAAPKWVIQGQFFIPPRRKSGTPVRFVNSGNVLITGAMASHYRFDQRFDKTGGEDTHFFERARLNGARYAWAEEARVVEFISRQRTTVSWIANRARSRANRYTRCCLCNRPGISTYFVRVVTGIGAILYGIALMPGSVFGKHHGVKALATLGRGIGTLSALGNHSQLYYSN